MAPPSGAWTDPAARFPHPEAMADALLRYLANSGEPSSSHTLATFLATGSALEAAVARATLAGALACLRLGVVPGLPSAAALDAALA